MDNDLIKSNDKSVFSENFVLSKKQKGDLLKSFAEGTKRILLLKGEINKCLELKEIEMAKQAKIDDIYITIFDGSNYSSWEYRLLNVLEYKECKEQATRAATQADDQTAWKKAELKAKNILISSVSDKQLEYIKECKTAHEMLRKFESMYSTKSTALQILNRGQLENVKLNNYDKVEDFFADFEQYCNKFKSAGGTLNEEEKIRYIIKALPPTYSYIGDFIDIIPQDQRTFDYVKSKILEKNTTRNDSSNRKNASTFNTKIKGQCYNCGKEGHLKKDCWKPPHFNQSSQGRGSSFIRGRGQRGFHRGSQRGSTRGFPQRSYGQGRGSTQERGEASSQHRENNFAESWVTRVNHNEINQVNTFECDSENQISWLLDSGCTDHIVNSDKYFEKCIVLKNPIDVKLPDGKKLKATKLGNIKTYFKTYYNEKEVYLKNVYYVKGISKNLLSFSKITENSTIVSREQNAKIYNKNRELVAVAEKVNDLYMMKSFIYKNDNENIYANTTILTDKEKWHRALGHVNFQYLSKLVNEKLLDGLPEKLEQNNMRCANCIQSKMANVPFENEKTKSTEILELIHTDLNGPHRNAGYGGEKYFLSFIDDYSKCSKVYCIKSKDETAGCLIDYVNLVENQFNKRVKKIQCDNGKEYLNQKIYNFVKIKGIELLPCPPYVHQLNGVAERFNRSAMDIGRCLLREAKIHVRYWPEIIKTVSYLKNRTIANTKENKTPYEILIGNKPDVSNLKIYGSKVFVRTPEILREGKWDDKAKIGILVGYMNNGYRVLINNKVINARHVKVIENETELICLEKIENENFVEFNLENENDEMSDDTESELCENDANDNEKMNEQTNDEIESEMTNDERDNVNNAQKRKEETLTVKRTSSRKKGPVERYGNPITHYIYVNYVNANVPSTFEEALDSKDSKEWQKAMNSEIESLKKNKTWVVVDKPENKKIIDVKWVYKAKSDNSYKARLVVKGFQQKESIENVYSPVGKTQTLKILLSYCCVNNLYIEQMDVETAFLNGKIKSEVYICEPKGYETGRNKVCRLLKALYGLRESPRAWYETFNDFLEKLNFVRSKHDYCLYVNNTNNDSIYILVFVDDILICCKDKRKIHEIKTKLMQKFVMKDMGKVKSYIGIDIDYDCEKGKMTLSQEKYIESLAVKYNLENAKLYNTPMETNLKLDQATETDESIKYRNLIGELLYISTGTRPDVAFSVNYLSRYQSCYDSTHFKYALRILKYLYKTKDLKLTYCNNVSNEKLDCMVDSDFAGDHVDRKSTTGFVIRLFGNVVYWKTQKQKTVTKNSTFAEYIAMSDAVTEILFMKDLLSDVFNLNMDKPIKIYEDNSGAVAIGKFGNLTKNSKHIEVQYHYINENYEKDIIDIVKIDTNNNVADMLTKSLCKEKFVKNRKALKLM